MSGLFMLVTSPMVLAVLRSLTMLIIVFSMLVLP